MWCIRAIPFKSWVTYTIYSDTHRLEGPLKVGLSPVKRTKTFHHRALSWFSAAGFTGDRMVNSLGGGGGGNWVYGLNLKHKIKTYHLNAIHQCILRFMTVIILFKINKNTDVKCSNTEVLITSKFVQVP